MTTARKWIEVGRPDRALEMVEAGDVHGWHASLYRLAALVTLGRWGEVERVLEEEAGSFPAECARLVDWWTARAYGALGAGASADRAWERLEAAAPELVPYVDLWRLESAARTGDVARGEGAWERIRVAGLPDAARRDAEDAMSRLYETSARYDLARDWRLRVADQVRGPDRAHQWIEAARLADLAGDATAADGDRRRVIENEPVEGAPIVLDQALRERLGISDLRAARVLLEARRHGDAERFATLVIESGPDEEELTAAILIRAEARVGLGDRQGAESDYADFISRWPSDPKIPEALYQRARLALRSGEAGIARQRFENLVARFPDHDRADDALYLTADSYQDDHTGDPGYAARAIESFDRLVRSYPSSYFADRAYLRGAHLAFALGRYADAARRYRTYGGRRSAREARYWHGRSLEAQGEIEHAHEIYRSLASGSDYYALVSRGRLTGGGTIVWRRDTRDGPGRLPPASEPVGLFPGPSGRRAESLLALGESRYAGAEIERAVQEARRDSARLALWAPILDAWGFPDLKLRIGVWMGGEDHPYAYPAGFRAEIASEAEAHRLDPWYMFALIRQESLFEVGAVSPADARGLMQILPETGEEIARREGWRAFDSSSLFRSGVNLHFGSVYLAEQLERFEGFWPAVLAAYNAGPEVVDRWWGFPERSLDRELWIDRIPYRETRDYVKKVIAYRQRYMELHAPDR